METKSKIQVGDRVRAYGVMHRGGWYESIVGTVVDIESEPLRAWVKLDDVNDSLSAHPKQCRRLKPPKPRREWWLGKKKGSMERLRAFDANSAGQGVFKSNGAIVGADGVAGWTWIKVREVRVKK